MGRSYTYTYIVVTGTKNGREYIAGWNNKSKAHWGYGTPNAKNLKEYVERYRTSLTPEGVNNHLVGIINPPTWGRIERQSTGEVIATYQIA